MMAFAQTERPSHKMEGGVHRAARTQEERSDAKAIRRMDRLSRKVALRALTADEKKPVSRKAGLVASGVNRELPENATASGEWGTSPEGKRVWRLSAESSGAEAVRVKFTGFHVGGGSVW